jgi:hypothetical protein
MIKYIRKKLWNTKGQIFMFYNESIIYLIYFKLNFIQFLEIFIKYKISLNISIIFFIYLSLVRNDIKNLILIRNLIGNCYGSNF